MKDYKDEAFDELEKAQQRKVATGVTDGSKKDAALRLALEALEGLFGTAEQFEGGGVAVWRLGGSYQPKQAIAAIKEALAQPEQEPVNEIQIVQGIPFFTPPKQCSWVGLTQEEVELKSLKTI